MIRRVSGDRARVLALSTVLALFPQYWLSTARVKHDRAWSPEWMGDRTVLGFAPALNISGVKFCADFSRPSDETVNQNPPCVYACKKITHAR